MDELKGEKCPRISAEDLIELGELAGAGFSRSPTKKRQGSKPMIFIVDVRSQEEYPLVLFFLLCKIFTNGRFYKVSIHVRILKYLLLFYFS